MGFQLNFSFTVEYNNTVQCCYEAASNDTIRTNFVIKDENFM